MNSAEQDLILDTFVELADTLAGGYDIGEFLQLLIHRVAELMRADTAGVLLESPEGHLQLAAAVSEEMRQIEELEIRSGEGPSTEAYQRAEPVIAEDLHDFEERWPQVAPKLLAMGMRSAHGFPMRLRDECIGAINLYRTEPGNLDERDRRLGQALADIAAIGIIQERKVTAAERVSAQLQHALDSRVVIEQAKGITAERFGVPTQKAFEALRGHARDSNRTLRNVCQEIVDGGEIPVPR